MFISSYSLLQVLRAGPMKRLGMAVTGSLLISGLVACSGDQQVHRVDRSSSDTFFLSEIKTGGTPAKLADDNRKLLEDKLNEVLEFCLPRLSGFEKQSAAQARQAYWLSMSGLVAGSVFVPVLAAASPTSNAAAIAGLGGWAGATNFAGESLKTSGLSGTTIAETRNKMIRKVESAIAVATDGRKSFDQRRDALMDARTACIIYEIAVPTVSQEKK
ncbi:hypothetical protein SAMN05444352_103176 [Pseudomonas japonica]|uniref:Uncharacterized protein n=2 Tax=Pseudomonas japonica TaxID=256466 RepID=A0A239BU54_9PSED|nr:hypothetical protein SAMN05444352_103176 [Pseudomonas japonica]